MYKGGGVLYMSHRQHSVHGHLLLGVIKWTYDDLTFSEGKHFYFLNSWWSRFLRAKHFTFRE